MLKPRRLREGATIGLISPASAADPEKVDAAIRNLEKRGFRVREGKHIRDRYGFLAASDTARIADLHTMFADPEVDAIMCVRGGYGTARLAPFIDYNLIARNPKILSGFSDITFLQLAIWKMCGLVTFNGPMLVSAFATGKLKPFTLGGYSRTLMQPSAAGSVWQGHRDRKFRVVRPGKASGRLTGGNLSLVAATLGTPYEIETKGRIVFLEDVDEKPYRIDRMLTQLLLAGKLGDAAGIVFGRNVPDEESARIEQRLVRRGLPKTAAPPPSKVPREFEQVADHAIADRLRPLGIPVLIGLPFGHIDDYATLPIGVRASMDTRTGELTINEAAVR
jgi:muramoyltetrapeptide carboxypeptidase